MGKRSGRATFERERAPAVHTPGADGGCGIAAAARLAARVGGAGTLEELAASSAEMLRSFVVFDGSEWRLSDLDGAAPRLFHVTGGGAAEPAAAPSSRLRQAITADGVTIGDVAVARARPDAFDDRDRAALALVAELIADSYRRIRAEAAQRRQRDGSIEQQNRRLRSLNDAIPDLLFSVARSGRLTFVKDVAHRDLLVSPDEAADLTVASIFAPALAAELLGAVAAAIDTGAVQTVEYRLDLPHGPQTFEARMARMSADEVTVMVRNVTEDRQRSQELRAQRERLGALLATTSALVYSARLPDLSMDFVSDSATAMLGFTPAEMMAPGFWQDAVHPDDRARVVARTRELFAHGRVVTEYRHRHRDGGHRWLLDELRLVLDAAGAPSGVVGAAVDLTARKAEEARLAGVYAMQRVVARLSRAFLASPGGDPDDVVREPLAELAGLVGARRASVLRCSGGRRTAGLDWCADGVDPCAAAPSRCLEVCDEPLRQGRPLHPASASDAAAYEALRAARGVRSLAAVPLSIDGELRGMVCVDEPDLDAVGPAQFASSLQLFADAVAAGLRRAETRRALEALNLALEDRVAERTRALQRSEERFEQLFQHAPQAMLIFDLEGRVAQSNLNAQRLFGYDAADLLGLPMAALLPDGEATRGAGADEALAVGGPLARGERRDRSRFVAEVGLVPLRLDDEPAMLAGLSDVSERRRRRRSRARCGRRRRCSRRSTTG